MRNLKRLTRFFSLLLIIIVLTAVSFGATAAYADEGGLYAGGFPAGFVLNTKTVEVVGICDVMTENGIICPARKGGLKSGDIIERVNEIEINSTEDLNAVLKQNFDKFILKVKRGDEVLEIGLNPATEAASGKKRFGLLVKDSINGIGTVTYIDKSNNKFGSLGHPVSNLEGEVIQINGGCLYGCIIYEVKRGQRGAPGEIRGVFENENMIGRAAVNCEYGVFGDISSELNTVSFVKVKRGSAADAKMGRAEIYSTVQGNKPKKYEISIVKVDADNKDNRNFVIKIEDKELLDATGGIVQGMSGSPIIQEGRLIGAVTHVFVNDPTRGYGISIDKMMGAY